MAVYKQKPVEVKAVRYNGLNWEEIENFLGTELEHFEYWEGWSEMIGLECDNIEGIDTIYVGDCIVKDPKGRYHKYTTEAFELCYEKIMDSKG